MLGITAQNVDVHLDSLSIYNLYLMGEQKRNLALINPSLATEWHPTKNGNLIPEYLAANSSKKVWWKCKKGHEWQASLHNRSKGKGCPYCSGRTAVSGENDLKTQHPNLIKEWNYKKNYPLLPDTVKSGSNQKVWWICSNCGHEWYAAIVNRTKGRGCPKCASANSGKAKRKSHSQFESELHSINPQVKLLNKYEVSTQKVMCRCKVCGHEWQALPGNLLKGKGCPICARKRHKHE